MAMFDGRAFQGHTFDQEMRLFVESETPPPSAKGPQRVGTSGVGTIVETGSAVTRWQTGDCVFGLMDIRETNICQENAVWELGDIDPLLALCIEPAYVSIHCVRESNVRYGDQVAVVGLGALGLLAVSMAAQAGAETVIAVDPLATRRDWALQNGADYALDPKANDAALHIHELTRGHGVDVAIELSGTYAGLNTAIRSVRVGGTVCAAGFYQGEAHGLWLGREWHHNRLNVVIPHGCGWGHPPRDYPLWDKLRAYGTIASMMRKGKLVAPGMINPVVTMEEAPQVFELIREDPSQVIKFAVQFQ
jgi:threonine dehydrogenase-like Zn-dependent dehydrogenase